MSGLDEHLAQVASGRGPLLVLVVAVALGLRHAADPDHLVAVSTLVAGARGGAGRAAALLGGAWGAGHAVTLLAFGLPVLLVRTHLPPTVTVGAEVAIGAVIAALAVRLLVQWRRGAFHTHVHDHGGLRHVHLHSHAPPHGHAHEHAARTPAQAFALGLLHGTAGSAGIAVLLVAAVPDRTLAAAALLTLAAGAALSMTVLSALAGRLLAAAATRRVLGTAVPALGSLACLFGVWYAVEALRGL